MILLLWKVTSFESMAEQTRDSREWMSSSSDIKSSKYCHLFHFLKKCVEEVRKSQFGFELRNLT